MLRIVLLCMISCLLTACMAARPKNDPVNPSVRMTPGEMSHLQQGQRYFETGFYKHAMKELLPLACDGIPEAQYAVGYMYYYGYGVAQDTEVGHFWIERSASKGYEPAIVALTRAGKELNKGIKPKERYR